MGENMSGDKLLDYFGVSNHKELEHYMRTNPEDPKAIELKELMDSLNNLMEDDKNDQYI